MRTMPDRYAMPKPAKIKQQPSKVEHVSAPLKGLNLSSKLTTGDPLTAPILVNFVIEDDRITCRAGHRKAATVSAASVEMLVPWYGPTSRMAAASGGALIEITTLASWSGFASNDWSWTSFANLGQDKFTVMVNGFDGLWSWDGGLVADPATVAVTAISNSNPAVVTVGAGDIANFKNGQAVLIAGATGLYAPANGRHYITSVGTPANTFTLIGVDTSTAAGGAVTGVTADAPGSMQKEIITAPPSALWINPDAMNIVIGHQNHLFLADRDNLAVYYLPLQSKSGELGVLPLNAIFKRGGTIRALGTWTTEGGVNFNDQLCIFTSNGECAIFGGVDPDSDFQLSGVFRFDAPMSKHSIINFGGDLYVLISTGLVPLTTLIRAEGEQLGQIDKSVISLFLSESTKYRDRPGWQAFLNPSSNRCMCNIPQGSSDNYTQMVRHMPRPVWSQWQDVPARCWGWIEPYLYFGDDHGNVYQMHPDFLNDSGQPIRVDVQMAWSQFKTPAMKHFKMVQTFLISDGVPRPFIDIKTDYDLTEPAMQPDVTLVAPGAIWDLATWEQEPPDPANPGDYWAVGPTNINLWNGVGRLGRVGAPRLVAYVLNATLSITGWDVMFEAGAAL